MTNSSGALILEVAGTPAGSELPRPGAGVAHPDKSGAALARPEFAQHVQTDHKTVAQVADEIARSAGLTIAPSTDGPIRALLHRYVTTARHVRWS